MSLPERKVYRGPSPFPRPDAVAAVAASTRGHIDATAAARSVAAEIAATTGASSVAIVAGGITIAVHRDGHDLMPLSPSAAAAVQGDPATTVVTPLRSDTLPKPASLVTVGADIQVDLAALAEIAALGIDLAAMMDVARQSDRVSLLKDEFVAHVSHELRAPLTTIIGALQTIERLGDADDDGRGTELRTSALEGASRLRRLVEDLLMATRMGREVPVRFGPTRVDIAVQQAIADVSNAGDVEMRIQGPLPDVQTDHDHLRRIVTNLVDNAIRHGAPPIEVAARSTGQEIEIVVSDHGGGLPPAVAAHPFTGDHPSSAGLGLGLRIAGGLADAIGSSITYEMVPGGGARFRLVVPRRF